MSVFDGSEMVESQNRTSQTLFLKVKGEHPLGSYGLRTFRSEVSVDGAQGDGQKLLKMIEEKDSFHLEPWRKLQRASYREYTHII